MAANAISTAGMTVKYKLGTDAGNTIPEGAFTEIPGVKALPALGNEPNTLDSTPLSATKNKTYVLGLSDSGGAIQLTVNDYSAFRAAWTAVVNAYKATTNENGYPVWFEYCYPEDSDLDSFYIPAVPVDLGFGGAEVDAILENNACIVPVGDYKFAAPSHA